MSNTSFQFKQFSISHDRCAHKVGTDGVLLGAWAPGGRQILDIGTGSALVALMMAQRFPEAEIDGVEIDPASAEQARENVGQSPWRQRVSIFQTSLQAFRTEKTYDSIVCNPPFFVNSLKNPDSQRSLARHTDSLPFALLCQQASALLKTDGVFSVVLPCKELEVFESIAWESGFYTQNKTYIKTTPKKPSTRCLATFRKASGAIPNAPASEEEVVLCLTDGSRSDWYSRLTQEFYL